MTVAFFTVAIVFLILAAFIIISKHKSDKTELARFTVKNTLSAEEYMKLSATYASTMSSSRNRREMWTPNNFGRISVDRFMELLRQHYAVEAHSQNCDLQGIECQTIFELKKDGKVAMMFMSNQQRGNFDPKKRPIFQAEGFDITDYYIDGDELSMSNGVEIIFPVGETKFMDAAKNAFLDSVITGIKYPNEEKEEQISFFKLVYGVDGLELIPKTSDAYPLTNNVLGVSYDPFPFKWNGKTYNLDPIGMMKVTVETLLSGGNVFAKGKYGTGKTTFMNTAMKWIKSIDPFAVCISLDAGVIGELNSINAAEQFVEAVRHFKNQGRKIIIMIDEAEELMMGDPTRPGVHTAQNSWLLKLLNGETQSLLNCSTMLIYNAEKKDLNQAFFRDMRCTFELEFKPLSAANAKLLVEKLQSRYKDRVFDHARFNLMLNTTTYNDANEIVAHAGLITQAQVAACFIKRDLNMVIQAAITRTLEEIGEKVVAVPEPIVVKQPVSNSSKWEDDEDEVNVERVPKVVAVSVPVQNTGKKKDKNRHKNRHQIQVSNKSRPQA